LIKALGTKLHYSTSHHPQTDGQSERVNQCLEQYLRCAVQDNPRHWKKWLSLAEFWYNSSFHSSLGCSPFKAVYGREPNLGQFTTSSPSGHADLQTWLKEKQHLSQFLRQHLLRAQEKMKADADKNRTPREFQVGETVFLKLQPYAQSSVVNRPFPKLAMKFYGPFTILEKIGQSAYKLQLSEASLVHPVFHVSQLKTHVPDHTPVFTTLPDPLPLATNELQPEEILDRRLVKKGNAALLQVLVRWTNLPATSATWEDYDVVHHRFPAAQAWGQAGSPGGDTVTAAALKLGAAVPGRRKLKKDREN
jgi:hypothetical protein